MQPLDLDARSQQDTHQPSPLTHLRIPELDGFRAIAVCAVVIHHAFYGWADTRRIAERFPLALRFVIDHGWLGVDLFFVLSGFLITGILLDTREEPGYFKYFYLRRILRIFPLYFACIAVMSLGYPEHSYFLLSILFLANMVYAFGVSMPHGPGVFWSLAVEEHFYLLWPVLNRVLRRRMFALLAIGVVVMTPVARIIYTAQGLNTNEQTYLYSWFRFDGLALGALLAMWMRSEYSSKRNTLRLAAGLAAVCIIVSIGGLPFHIMSKATPAGNGLRSTQAQLIFAASMAASLALQGHWLTAFLRTSFMRVIADLSYCIYLVHLTIGDAYDSILRYLQINAPGHIGETWAAISKMLFMVVTSFAIAAASKRWLEDPCRRLMRYFEPRDKRTPAAADAVPAKG